MRQCNDIRNVSTTNNELSIHVFKLTSDTNNRSYEKCNTCVWNALLTFPLYCSFFKLRCYYRILFVHLSKDKIKENGYFISFSFLSLRRNITKECSWLFHQSKKARLYVGCIDRRSFHSDTRKLALGCWSTSHESWNLSSISKGKKIHLLKEVALHFSLGTSESEADERYLFVERTFEFGQQTTVLGSNYWKNWRRYIVRAIHFYKRFALASSFIFQIKFFLLERLAQVISQSLIDEKTVFRPCILMGKHPEWYSIIGLKLWNFSSSFSPLPFDVL